MSTLVCIRNATVITLDDADRVFAPGEIWIDGGRIVAVGPAGQAMKPPREPAEIVDASGRIVIPGLINAHAHSYAALLKGTIDALPLDLYMLQVIAGGSFRTPRQVYISTLLDCIDLLRTGTTAVIDHFSHRPAQTGEAIDAACQAYADAGMRAAVAPMFSDRPYEESIPLRREAMPAAERAGQTPAPPADAQAYFDVLAQALRRWQGHAGRLQLLLGVDGPQRCTPALLEQTGDFAARHRLGLHTHLLETKTQALMVPPQSHGSFVAYLDRFGLVNPCSSLVHFVWCTPRDIEIAAERGVNVVHVPISNLHLGSGIQPAIRLLERGIPVALGTDGGNCAAPNMFEVVRTAARLSRVTEPDHERWITARTALRMATAHGARALGMGGELGVIAPAARADLVLLDARRAQYRPSGNLFNHLAFYENGSGVDTVFVEGEKVVANGRLVRIDEDSVLAEAEDIAARLRHDNRAAFEAVERQRPLFQRMVINSQATPHDVERLARLR